MLSALAADPNQMIISPNPIQDNAVSFRLGNVEKGSYVIQVFNINGQMIKKISVQHNGGEMRYNLSLNSNLPAGKIPASIEWW